MLQAVQPTRSHIDRVFPTGTGLDITLCELGKRYHGKYYNHYARANWHDIVSCIKNKLGIERLTVRGLLNAKASDIISAPRIGIRRVEILLKALEAVYGYSLKKDFLDSERAIPINIEKLEKSQKRLKDVLERKT